MKAFLSALALGASALPAAASGEHGLTLKPLDTYESGIFAEGAAEIVAWDGYTQRIFVVNAAAVTVDVLDGSKPNDLRKIDAIDASAFGGFANSVAVHGDVLAVAIESADKQANGLVALYRTKDLKLLNTVPVGALPDMVTFDETGRYILVANEGEPNADYSVDPAGSVSIIDLKRGAKHATVRHATFDAFNDKADELRAAGVRLYGPNATVAQDVEPEYITTSGGKAYVTLQEANAVAVVDIARATVTKILPLGYKDHSLPGNGLDPSDRDSAVAIANWPVFGIYSPDAINSYSYRGKTYLVTANEGDTRAYDTFNEEVRVGASAVKLDATAFPNASALKANAALGRLTVTNTLGDTDGDGDYDALYVPGGRSFSIWSSDGKQVFDSGSDFESITANLLPGAFNSNHEEQPSADTRSDNKGPEPEGLAIGEYLGRTYAFVGLERTSGVMIYDITNPRDVTFVDYVNRRDFTVPVCITDAEDECAASNPAAGDLGPEGLTFVPWDCSPTGRPLLIVGNEISGSTTVYELARK
ncbi:DNA-binding beta-propeller fold protein YncE [Povalibacter uvarum]|uniref:DNA-binding beta-propeller fold protein YncE n=1 Tax=Povalibacter uvarum TaxID=732238 RepID=A0A841HJX7_9GAMM|nr:choice-of-anchor I family protein [Povalibacter uvarum]MBB6092884.1 DNA-binding beta-propeller fold protein YncE [Povalibacter uvarum]